MRIHKHRIVWVDEALERPRSAWLPAAGGRDSCLNLRPFLAAAAHTATCRRCFQKSRRAFHAAFVGEVQFVELSLMMASFASMPIRLHVPELR